MRSEGWFVVCLSVGPSVAVTTFFCQQTVEIVTPTDSALHWLDFKKGDFRKSAAFRSYGVKTK